MANIEKLLREANMTKDKALANFEAVRQILNVYEEFCGGIGIPPTIEGLKGMLNKLSNEIKDAP